MSGVATSRGMGGEDGRAQDIVSTRKMISSSTIVH